MSDGNKQTTFTFREGMDGKDLLIEIFEDGSAYVRGEDIEMIFDDSPDAFREAITYLERLGFTKIPPERF